MRDPQDDLFRPTNNLQFSDAAVRALQAAERRPTGLPLPAHAGTIFGWLSYGIAVCILLLILHAVFGHLSSSRTASEPNLANDHPTESTALATPNRDASQASAPGVASSLGSDSRQPEQSSQAASCSTPPPAPASTDRLRMNEDDGVEPRHVQWIRTQSRCRLPVFEEADLHADLVGVIMPGTQFWLSETGEQCVPGLTWKHVMFANQTDDAPRSGMICAVDLRRRS